MNGTSPLEEGVAVIARDHAHDLVHLLFDLARAQDGAGTRGLEPVIVDRNRPLVERTLSPYAADLFSHPVDHPVRTAVGAARPFARGRVATAVVLLLRHSFERLRAEGLFDEEDAHRIVAPISLFAAETADATLAALAAEAPEARADLERRAKAA